MSGQRGSLGISIAGGKGSLPYKDHDEVSAGGEESGIAQSLATLYIYSASFGGLTEDDEKQLPRGSHGFVGFSETHMDLYAT